MRATALEAIVLTMLVLSTELILKTVSLKYNVPGFKQFFAAV